MVPLFTFRACVCGRKREIAACFACKGENTCAQTLSSRRLLCFTPSFAVVLVTLLSVLRALGEIDVIFFPVS